MFYYLSKGQWKQTASPTAAVIQALHTVVQSPYRFCGSWSQEIRRKGTKNRQREAAYLLSHPGQSALASGSLAASQGGRSRSFWPRPGERRHKTHPESEPRLYRSLTAPFKTHSRRRWVWQPDRTCHNDSWDVSLNGSAAFQSDSIFPRSLR